MKKPAQEEFYPSLFVNARAYQLGFIFAHLREGKRLSRARIALKVGVAVQAVEEFENGVRLLPVSKILRMGEIYGVNPEWVKVKWIHEWIGQVEDRMRAKLGVSDGF